MDNLNIQCQVCENWESMEVESADYKNWQEGTLIQDALSYLTADQRELLISATCGTCWDEIFWEEDEDGEE